ncbi:MAG: choice-of-anchor D domain-containing protein [Bacteroidetes bacterium]|nr:MAG: choice-of-anchor D domain-containing protein [Bacteroidota bacterium]
MKRILTLSIVFLWSLWGYAQQDFSRITPEPKHADKEYTDYDKKGHIVYAETSIESSSYNKAGKTESYVSATYTLGDIATHFSGSGGPSAGALSDCPATLIVTIPLGAQITGVDVSYSMTAASGAYMSEQYSKIICTSPGGAAEAAFTRGVGGTGGTYSYNRQNLTIASNVTGGGEIAFQMHAFRSWGGSGCTFNHNKVDNGTWTVKVYYDLELDYDAALTQIIQPEEEVAPGTVSDFTVVLANNGINTLTAVDIDYVIGQINGTYNWTGSLERFESEEVTLYANYLFDVVGAVDLSATINWDLDELETNNHLERTVEVVAGFTMLEPIGEGTVTPAPGDYSFAQGMVVDLLAYPAIGYTFSGWNLGNVENNSAARTFIEIGEDDVVQATFTSYNADMVWLQNVSGESASTSFINETAGFEVADNFRNSAIEEIAKVVVYGLTLTNVGGSWVEWTPGETEPFVVRFYDQDANTEPDWANPVSAQMVDARVFNAGPVWNGQHTAYRFELDLTSPVDLSSGWVSVQINATNDEAPGWFLWLVAGQGMGDGKAWQQNLTGVNTLLNNDFMLELWGTEGDVVMAPDCINPIFPANNSQNVAKNVTLNWQQNVNALGYILYLGADELPETGIDVGDVISYPAELGYETTYYWSVVPYNDGGEAENCTVFSFTTRQDPTLYPSFVENFNTTPFPPVNWSRFSGTLGVNTTLTPVTSIWTHGTFGNVPGTANSAYLNIYNARNHWLVTPSIDLGDGETDYQLVFDMALTPWTGTAQVSLGPNDYVAVVISADNGQTWSNTNVLIDWNAASPMSPTGIPYELSLEGYSGLVKLGFYVYRLSGTTPDLRIYFDNIGVTEAPSEPLFVISHESIDFGSVELDEVSAAQTITISNEGAMEIVVQTPLLDNNIDFILSYDVANFPATLAANESVTFTVAFNPQELGSIEGLVTVAYNDGEDTAATISLTGEGFDPTAPLFAVAPSVWNFGNVLTGNQSVSKSFTISNTAQGVLTVQQPVLDNDVDFILSFDAEIYPAELAAGESVAFSVVFDALTPGPKEGEISISYNDGAEKTAVVELTGNGYVRPAGSTCSNPLLVELPLENYLDHTSHYGDDYSNTWVTPSSSYLNGNDFVTQFTLEQHGTLSGSVSGSWTGVLILENCPNSDSPAPVLASGTGVSGGSFSRVMQPGTYFAIVSTFPAPQEAAFALNLAFAPLYVADFVVTNGVEPIEGALISVTGAGTKLTGPNGQAQFVLDNGEYGFTISAEGFATHTGSLTIDGADVLVPEVVLLGNHEVTLNVNDADGPLNGVSVHITGNADAGDWSIDHVFAVDATLAIELPVGNYTWTASKENYYQESGDLLVSGDEDLDITMVIFPLVVFVVQNAENVPVQGVAITIEEMDPVVTNASGEVSLRLTEGNYAFHAFLLGYDQFAGTFSMQNGVVTEVTVVMQETLPTLMLTQDWSQGANFGNLLVGLTSQVTFEFTNTGFANLVFSVEDDVTITSENGLFSILQGAGYASEWNLATGQTGTITIQFAPVVAGAFEAELAFEMYPFVVVGLEGESYAPIALPFFDDFETNGFDNWVVVNGNQSNQWDVGTAHEDTDNLSAMISNDEGVSNAYTVTEAAVSHFYMDVAIPDGHTTLNFDWKGNGEVVFDFLRVSVVAPTVTPVAGTPLTSSAALGSFVNHPQWRNETFAIPAAFEGKHARIVFSWRNNSVAGTQPPAAVDNIMITQTRDVELVSDIDDINVDYKTFLEELPLPETIMVTLDGDFFGEMQMELAVTWNHGTPVYNADLAGSYTFHGELALIPGLSNNTGKMAVVEVIVEKGMPVVTWPAASGITYGETLAASTLTGGSAYYQFEDVTGAFTFHTPDFMPQAGIYSADVTFTPDDTDNYAVVNGNVNVDVAQFPISVMARNIIKMAGEEYVFEGNEFTVDPADLFANDQITGVSLSSAGAEATAVVDVYPILISNAAGTGVANYAITYVEGEMEVTDKVILTLPNLVVADKAYDANRIAMVESWGELNGVLAGMEDVQLDFSNAEAMFRTTPAGNDIEVAVSGLALTGADADSYIIGEQFATASILKRDLTITAENKNKVYGQPDVELTVSFDSFAPGEGLNNLIGSIELDREPGEGAGEYAITVSGVSSPNYEIEFVDGVYTISPRVITIVADATAKTYGDDDPEFTFQVTDDELQFDDEFAGELAREEGEDTGEYQILQGTVALSDNYSLFFESAVFTITSRDISITADAISRIYGDTDPALTYLVTTGALQFDDEFTGELTREAGEDVGVYEIEQGTVALTDNYNLSYVGADFTITERALELTADAVTKVYGDDDPGLTYTITDGDLVFSDEITGELVREEGEDVGEYAITIGTITVGDNYLITLISDNLTITQRDLEITADAKTKVYGDDDPVFTWELTAGELQLDDAFAGVLARETGEDAGAYALNIGTLTAGANYNVTFVAADLTITPLAITVTADDKSKVYGETDPVFTYAITAGALVLDDAFEGELLRETGEDTGVYAIEQGSLTAGNNYDLTFVNGELTISQLAITVTADDKSKVYGDNDPSLTYEVTVGALVFDDAFTGNLTREAGENVGSYAIEQGTLAINDNYNLTFVDGELVISQRAITVTADDKSKVYGEADADLTWAVTAGELVLDDELSGELTREAGEDVGTYEINIGTLTAGANYVLTFVEGELQITAKEVTIGGSFEVADKDYDGTTEAVITDNQLVIIGVVGNDDVDLASLVAEFVSPEPGADVAVVLTNAAIAGTQAANYILSMEGAPATTADIFAPVYTLTIDIDPADAGTVAGEGEYEGGESVTVTAVANEGFAFNSWMIGEQVVSTDASYTFDMPAEDLTLLAKFDIIDAIDDMAVVSINLFPNPARDNFNITSGAQIRTVMIVDMAGKVVYTNDVNNTEVNIENAFETGIYFVRIYTDNGVFVRKLQIQK